MGVLVSLPFLALTRYSVVFGVLLEIHCFQLYNPCPTDVMLQVSLCSTDTTMENALRNFIGWSHLQRLLDEVPGTLQGSSRIIRISFRLKEFTQSTTRTVSSQEQHCCGIHSPLTVFLMTTILTSSRKLSTGFFSTNYEIVPWPQ